MKYFEHDKLGIVVNDFGSINADKIQLENDFHDIFEVTNGSLFCSCKSDKFVETLIKLSHKDIDTVIVESSGLADVSTLYTLLNLISQIDNNYYNFKGNICIADAKNFHKVIETAAMTKTQIHFADLILLNKTDLVSKDVLVNAIQIFRSYNTVAEIIPTTYSKVSKEKVMSLSHVNKTKMVNKKISLNTQTVTVFFDAESNSKIYDFMDSMSPYCNRIKGFLNNEEKVFIEYVGETRSKVPFDYNESSFVVFLSVENIDLELVVTKQFNSIFGYAPNIK